jgi:hypothetical protein
MGSTVMITDVLECFHNQRVKASFLLFCGNLITTLITDDHR